MTPSSLMARGLLPRKTSPWPALVRLARASTAAQHRCASSANRPLKHGDVVPSAASASASSARASRPPPILPRRGSSTPTKPLVLEKPARFNPPSHPPRGSRRASAAGGVGGRYYGPELTAEEEERQRTKRYPNMFPPEGTFMYWFLTNKSLHVMISMGFLFVLAVSVSFENFKRDSPFASMLPPFSQLFLHPIRFGRTLIEVFSLHKKYRDEITAEKRKRLADDVGKRTAYRRAHGLDMEEIFGWNTKDEGVHEPGKQYPWLLSSWTSSSKPDSTPETAPSTKAE